MPAAKSGFLDKVLGRISRLAPEGLQTVVAHLARERQFLETLFETIEDGILVVDEHGEIIYFNSSVTRLIGLPADAAVGETVKRYLPQLDWDGLIAADQSGGARAIRQELEINYPQPRFLRLYASPLDGEAAGSSGVALVMHDATEARQQTVEAIESERIQALTLLAASVAHEIGNPLNALHIHLQLMEREMRKVRDSLDNRPSGGTRRRLGQRRSVAPMSDEQGAEIRDSADRLEKYVEVAKGEITRLDYIITQYLRAIRPSAPQKKLCSLNGVVRETVKLLLPELENRGQKVEEQLRKKLPSLLLDPAQIKQALVNLMKNAMQAMTKDGVLTLRTGFNREGIWLSVEDTGRGISSEQLNRIFEPFFTTKTKGSGLGLMIVQRIVRDHAGLIRLDSEVEKGTTFQLWFPRREQGPRLLGEGEQNDPGQEGSD